MSTSLYISMTGLQAYSNGLNSISNNVSNMNTTGYKKNDLLFQDLLYKFTPSASGSTSPDFSSGSGVTSDRSFINFGQGDIRETNKDTDVAIDGSGLFILKDENNNFLYTRNGTFEFASNGDLVLQSTNLKVQSLNSSGNLENITLSGNFSDPASATSEILLTGNLATTSSSFTLNDVEIIDSLGEIHVLSIELAKDVSLIRTWNVTIKDENGDDVDTGGQIQFQGNGSPQAAFNTYNFSYTPDGLSAQTITLDFGEPDTFSGVTSFTGSSDLVVKEQDGYASGGLVSTDFDRSGVLERNYSNGKTYFGQQLALADFRVQSTLQQIGNGLFQANDLSSRVVAQANSQGMGEIAGKSLELSNVELSDQFTDMVIIQRGYQASSQVLTATNEMIQQLIEATKSR